MHQFFVSANAPHRAAARLFLEWGTSLKAQDALAGESGGLVGHTEWEDRRPINKKSWYQPPAKGIDVAWQDGPSQDESDKFIEEWLKRLGSRHPTREGNTSWTRQWRLTSRPAHRRRRTSRSRCRPRTSPSTTTRLRRWTDCRSPSSAAGSSRCSARPGAARRPCCGPSPDSTSSPLAG